MSIRTIIVRNTKVTDDFWVGRLIAASESYQLETEERRKWADDDKVVTDIQSGDLVVNDGIIDLTAAQGELWVTADFLLEIEDEFETLSKFIEIIKVSGGTSITDTTLTQAEVSSPIIDIGGGVFSYHDVVEFGEGGAILNKFMKSAYSAHTSLDSTAIALTAGQVVHCTISTEKDPTNNWFVQVIINGVKGGAGQFAGGTQIGADLEKPTAVLDKVYVNLTGYNFSAEDRIQVYVKAGTLGAKSAVEPVVRLFVRYGDV